jgi:hypothetical protein
MPPILVTTLQPFQSGETGDEYEKSEMRLGVQVNHIPPPEALRKRSNASDQSQ